METGRGKKGDHGQQLTGFELMDFAMNKVHEAAYLVDENARFYYVNDNAFRILGYTREELLKLRVSDIDPDYPVTRWNDHWTNLKKSGSLLFEGRHQTKDGRIFPVEINANYFEYKGQAYNLALIRDITERKRNEQALFEGQQVFRTLVENSPDIIARYNLDCQRIFVNPAYLKVAGVPQAQVIETSPMQYSPLPAESAKVLQELINKVIRTGIAEDVDVIWPKEDNVDHWYNIYASPEFDREGKIVSVMTTSRDITHRKQVEAQVLKLNRIYAVLSNINQAIVRIHETKELLNEACRIVITYGKFRMAWVGMINFPTNKIDIVASHGVTGDYLEKIDIDLSDEKRSNGPTGIAVKTGKNKISNNIIMDDRLVPWRDNAIKYGYKSIASFPLIVFNKVIGAFTIYSGETDFFQDDDINLLDEMAKDISFALEFIESETRREQASQQLMESEQKFRSLAESSPDIIIRYGVDCRAVYVNHMLEEHMDSKTSSLIGKTPLESIPVNSVGIEYQAKLQQVIETGLSGDMEMMVPNLSSELRTHHILFVAERNNNGTIIGAIAIGRDITERVQAEEAQEKERKRMEVLLAALNTGLSLINPDMTIAWVNPQIREMFPGREPIGEICHIFYESRTTICEGCGTLQAFIDGKVIESEQFVPSNGKWYYIISQPIKDTAGRVVNVLEGITDITERKQAEEEMRNSEERYRIIAENTADTITVLDLNLNTTYISPSVLELRGYSVGEAKAQTLDQVLTPGSLQRVRTEFAAQMALEASGKADPSRTSSLELEEYCKDGSVIWVELVASFLRDKELKPVGIITVTRDITDRKLAEEERLNHLRFLQSLDQFNRSIQGTNDLKEMMNDALETALTIFDCDRIWLFYPCDPDAMLFRVPMEITRPEYPGAKVLNVDIPMPPDMAGNLREALGSDEPLVYTEGTEKPINKVSAEQFGVKSMMMVALFPKIGKPWAFGLHQCSHARVWTQEEKKLFQEIGRRLTDSLTSLLVLLDLKESEERYRIIAENTADTITVLDLNLNMTYISPSVLKLRGYSVSEAMTQSLDQVLTPGSFQKANTVFAAQLAMEEDGNADPSRTATLELEEYCKDGSVIWVELVASFLRDSNLKPVGIVTVTRDISERKKIEEEILKLNQELEQRVAMRTAQLEAANKELEAFSYSVSHDLRAPLRGIDGFSQILLEDYREKIDAEGVNHLQRVRAAAQHMAQLIDDLLMLSRVSRSEINIQKVNLSQIFLEISINFRETQPERKVEFIIPEGIHVLGDSHLLRIVLENLIGNAWKFTSKHPTACIEFGLECPKDRVVYFVRDDGAGFDMKHANKLFDAFKRLHAEREFPGTGIGLATVQRIIHRHGGTVWAEGAVEKGATIYFTIP